MKNSQRTKSVLTVKQVMRTACSLKRGRLNFEVTTIEPEQCPGYIILSTDKRFSYDSFFKDNGPLKLSTIYNYCIMIDEYFKDSANPIILHYTTGTDSSKSNAAMLFASYAIIRLSCSAETIFQKLTNSKRQRSFPLYRDASHDDSSRKLTLISVLRAIEIAVVEKFFDYRTFNAEEIDYYEEVQNGDLNWIIPGKLLAFAGPRYTSEEKLDGTVHHTPAKYFDYFHKNNVKAIVRLNRKAYDESHFTAAGFEHYDLIFPDGSVPSCNHILRFLSICEKTKGAVAVHCKAGLGRTGTMICCFLMYNYDMTAAEAIAWCRICRPGSVINPQQEFLSTRYSWLRNLYGTDISKSPTVKSTNEISKNGKIKEAEFSQGDELNLIKCTRKQLSI
ncbi:hypothetical protein GJ496_000276 [Pomphorhynchus laevis]|nr:hypothetical protein GJ496_000276 [Pomphorhynchus laevis]